jgi:hypothetical protein
MNENNNKDNKNVYSFDPLKHGFEPITYYPELGFNFSLNDKYFVKVVCYDYYDELVYWYKVICTSPFSLFSDDRIEIRSGSYNFRRPFGYWKQSNPRKEYLGLITSDEYAESLLKHLLGTTKNESLNTDSIIRYNENLGIKMRSEYPQYYNCG